MKKINITLIVLIFNLASYGQSNLENQIQNFNYSYFLNKPIDSLLANLPLGYDTAFAIGGSQTVDRGASLEIYYPTINGFTLTITITAPEHIDPSKSQSVPANIAWPLNLLRKEKIGSILLMKSGYIKIVDIDIY
jgi:hypothetical protein